MQILSMGSCKMSVVSGVYQKAEGHNIMLLDMENLVCDRMDELKAMGRLACEVELVDTESGSPATGSHHILTENCYLVFSVGQTYGGAAEGCSGNYRKRRCDGNSWRQWL